MGHFGLPQIPAFTLTRLGAAAFAGRPREHFGSALGGHCVPEAVGAHHDAAPRGRRNLGSKKKKRKK